MLRTSLALGLLLLATLPASAQVQERYVQERYVDVRLTADDGDTAALARRLAAAGVHLDHAAREKTAGAVVLRTVLSESELALARAAGVPADVLTADLAARAAQRSLAGCPTTTYPVTGSMGCFLTFAEIEATLDAMQAAYPDLISVRESIGSTHEDRPIWMVEISDNPGVDEGEPEALFTAVHHAREVQSPITVLYWMWSILEGYGSDPEATFLIDERRLFFVPVLNPDGYVYNQTTDPAGGGFWRKNRRDNGGGSFGVDLNRNYDYVWGLDNIGSSPNPGSDTYRGPEAFSEPETQALRDFLEDGRSVRLALNYHTYSDLLIYPWGYADETYTPDDEQFIAMSVAMTAINNYTYGTGPDILYPVNGGSDDWMYGEQTTKPKILAFTPEVGNPSDGFWPDPSRIEALAAENVRMNTLAALYAGAAPGVAGGSYADDGANGYVDPGEGVVLTATLRNDGQDVLRGPHQVSFVSDAPDAPLVYATLDQFVEGDLAPGEILEIEVGLVSVREDAPLGAIGQMRVNVTSANAPTVTFPLPDLLVGTPELFFADDATTTDGWTGDWGLTSDAVSAPTAFTESPDGDYGNNTTRVWELAEPLDLSGEQAATLSFHSRWDIEGGYDWAEVQVSIQDGPWEALAGRYTSPGTGIGVQPNGDPGYDGVQSTFVRETMDLSPYAGSDEVRLRFVLASDGGVTGDGWVVDDVEVFRLVNGVIVGAEASPSTGRVALGAPRPNPTTGTVRLRATVPTGRATVTVFDVLGRRVATLLDGDTAGSLDLVWDGTDASGAPAAPGVYLVRLESGAEQRTQRVLVTR